MDRVQGLFASRRSAVPVLAALAVGAAFGTVVSKWVTPNAVVRAQSVTSVEANQRLLDLTAQVFESVSQLVSPAVVYIESRQTNSSGKVTNEESGSGVLVRPESHGRPVIVTNHHVVANIPTSAIDIHLSDGRSFHPTKVYTDAETDLAVLETEEADLPAVKLGNSERVRVGEWVLAIGSPFGLMQSVTHGIISAKHRRQVGLPSTMRIKEFLQTDAAINPGNSGGPLVNLQGEVIGINTAIASSTGSSSGVGFSIPVNLVRRVTTELLTHGKVRRAFLGIGFPNDFDLERARRLGLSVARGALVAVVHPHTPAEQAGVQSDDVILELDGQPIEDENHLINLVSLTPIGSKVEIVVWRNRQRMKLQATLGNWEGFQSRPE